jgi:hypothetical protein
MTSLAEAVVPAPGMAAAGAAVVCGRQTGCVPPADG